jgi:aspartokinase/homoserine dehydrogenase 1
MIVLKFGGSALCDAQSLLLCAQKIVQTKPPYVIVVSAMRGVTKHLLSMMALGPKAPVELLNHYHRTIVNLLYQHCPELKHDKEQLEELIALCDKTLENTLAQCHNSPEHQAKVLAQGEWLCAQILCVVVARLGVALTILDPTQFIRTQGSFLDAEVVFPDTLSRIMPLREHDNARFLVPGFFGGNHATGQISLLGPNSSDYSGAIFAVGLGAFGYEIWKDIDGIFESDPKINRHALLKKSLTYKELISKANIFSQVVHPKVASLLEPLGIPLFIRNIFKADNPGTIIADESFYSSSKESSS